MWGCLAKVLILLPKRTKIGPKTIDCVFIGFENNSAAYRFLVIKYKVSNVHVDTIIEFNDAEFFEENFPYKEKETNSSRKRLYHDEFTSSSI